MRGLTSAVSASTPTITMSSSVLTGLQILRRLEFAKGAFGKALGRARAGALARGRRIGRQVLQMCQLGRAAGGPVGGGARQDGPFGIVVQHGGAQRIGLHEQPGGAAVRLIGRHGSRRQRNEIVTVLGVGERKGGPAAPALYIAGGHLGPAWEEAAVA